MAQEEKDIVEAGASTDRDQLTPGVSGQQVGARDRQIHTLDEMISTIKRPETAEERERRERREKSRGIVKAVGDGLRALSNMYFTTQYAPSMYEPSDSQTKAYEKRLEKAKAERQADSDRYYNLVLKKGELEALRDRESRERKAAEDKAAADALALKWNQEKYDEWSANKETRAAKEQGAANKAYYDSVYSRHKAESAPEYFKLRNDVEREKGATEKSKQSHNYSNTKRYKFEGKDYDEKGYTEAVMKAVWLYNEEHKDNPITVEYFEDTKYGSKPHPRDAEVLAGELSARKERDRSKTSTKTAAGTSSSTGTAASSGGSEKKSAKSSFSIYKEG